MEKIRGLIKRKPAIGWTLLLATIAISGFPPFGIFTSELMLLIATIKVHPWLATLILVGLITALAGLLRNIQPMVFGEPAEHSRTHANLFPAILHLLLVLVLGVYIPPILAQLLQQATSVINN
jgi:hydrogenase-4 component F